MAVEDMEDIEDEVAHGREEHTQILQKLWQEIRTPFQDRDRIQDSRSGHLDRDQWFNTYFKCDIFLSLACLSVYTYLNKK